MSEERFPCPCCGYLTLDHPADGSYDICAVCFWEDDIVQNENPTYAGGANKPSLIEARANFARFGAMEKRFTENVRPPDPDEIPPAVDPIEIAVALSRQIVAGEVEPYPGAVEIWRHVSETGQRDLDKLSAFVGLASEWQDDPAHRADLENDIRSAARDLLTRFGP